MPDRRKQQLERRVARERFTKARRVERGFEQQLRQVARQVGSLVKAFAPKGLLQDPQALFSALRQYADMLQPWAFAVVRRLHVQIEQKDTHAWEELARTVGQSIKKEIESAPTGETMRAILHEQVRLITSLPREAQERVEQWVTRGFTGSERASEIQKKIMETGHVTASRAKLIARTEVARTASIMTQARAQHIGSEGYVWRTSEDPDVRPDHKRLDGKFIRWDEPPIVDLKTGRRAHAGQDIQCRCYPEPQIPDKI